ncbi:5-oxoprolinase subunit B family protein [Pseudonocardia sp. H11422]|uniref:5-oxoprolinase subunit B family protein n=1 Tax=Pseudonocardia sp. H11422 TaxID=2835866 RepID=UPI001BDC362A|nr:allophanate hydrolase subunit 1 [Pseudonocardia sp. H11422]
MTPQRSVRPYGAEAVLVELADHDRVLDQYEVLVRTRPAGVTDIVPAQATVLITFDPVVTTTADVIGWVGGTTPAPRRRAGGAVVEIEVVYDGADLAEVGSATGLSPAEVVAVHTGTLYSVAFCGFAPGFAYLTGLPPRLHLPRRSSPRTRVPAGSVAIADAFSAVYPRPSPGGWHLLGRTDARLWDLAREVPGLLQPGDRVRFVEAA